MRVAVVCAVCCALFTPGIECADDEDFAVREKAVVRPEVLPDKALIYIVRPTSAGTAIRMWAFADDSVLALTKGDTYAFAYLEPGDHLFWSRAENVSALTATVEAGKTYYLKQSVRMGGLKARVRLEIIDETEGQEMLAKCGHHSTLTDAGKARAAEIAAEKLAVAQEKAAKGDTDAGDE
jgi:hypothetical protein